MIECEIAKVICRQDDEQHLASKTTDYSDYLVGDNWLTWIFIKIWDLMGSFLADAKSVPKAGSRPVGRFTSKPLDFFRNSLCLKKLKFFVHVGSEILRACVSTWPKNLWDKMPKKAILASKWNFERSLFASQTIGLAQALISKNDTTQMPEHLGCAV